MNEEAVYAHRFTGKRYDCGSKLGYLQATVEYALAHPQLGKDFRAYLNGMFAQGRSQAQVELRRLMLGIAGGARPFV